MGYHHKDKILLFGLIYQEGMKLKPLPCLIIARKSKYKIILRDFSLEGVLKAI